MLLSELPPHLLATQAVMLTDEVVLLSMSEEEGTLSPIPSLKEPPFGSVLVQSRMGPFRIAATLWQHLDHEADPSGDTAMAVVPGPFVFGADLEEIVGEIDEPSHWRLLNFLLGFCRKAFNLADNEQFAAACIRLASLFVADPGTAEPIATVTRAWTVLRAPQLDAESSCFVLGPRKVRRTKVVPLPGLRGHSAVGRVGEGDVLLAMTESAKCWIVGPAPPSTKDLILPQPDLTALRDAGLRALLPVCADVAAALRELLLLSPSAPIRHDDPRQPIAGALDVALSDGEGRLFLRGWLHDPMHLVQDVTLRTPGGDVALPPETLFRHRRPDIQRKFETGPFAVDGGRCGFVAYVQDPTSGACLQPTLELRLRSGSRVALRPALLQPGAAASRAAVLSSVLPSDVTERMLDDCIGQAAAAFHRRTFDTRIDPEIIEIGRQPANPAISIIVPLYRNLGFLRFQIAALASDPGCRGAELIIVLDSPEQRHEAEHLLRGLHAMYGRPIRLVIQSRNLGYAAANNDGARQACGRALLLLNSDVVPSTAGWLAQLETALSSQGVGAVGPKLLFDDGSIQHAGLHFRRDHDGVWLNAHYHKGMPAGWPGAGVAREVPGVTGAALLVRRDLFEAAGGICEDYVIGDYEDSDFCLRVRERGARILYVPSAELYHFERKSIDLHKGYTGTLACLYNRRLHHLRWAGAIEALMARPEFQVPGAGVTA